MQNKSLRIVADSRSAPTSVAVSTIASKGPVSLPAFTGYHIGSTVEAYIVTFLTVRDHVRCITVSKAFRAVASQPTSWCPRVDLSCVPVPTAQPFLCQTVLATLNCLNCRVTNLSLVLPSNNGLPNDGSLDGNIHFSADGQDLKTVVPGIATFLGNQTTLRTLHLQLGCSTQLTNVVQMLPAQGRARLQSLHCSYYIGFALSTSHCMMAHDGLAAMARAVGLLPNLVDLDIAYVVAGNNPITVFFDNMPKMRLLQYVQLGFSGISTISTNERTNQLHAGTLAIKLPLLHTLRVPISSTHDTELLRTLPSTLTHLIVDFKITWARVRQRPHVLDLSPVVTCTSLRALDVHAGNVSYFTPDTAEDDRKRSLEWLNALRTMPLTRLRFYHTQCEPLHLSAFAATLTELYISEAFASLQQVLPLLTCLKRLELCDKADDTHVTALSGAVGLEWLRLGCEVQGWGFLKTDFGKLRHLDLSWNTCLDLSVVLSKRSQFAALEKLVVRYCKAIKDTDVPTDLPFCVVRERIVAPCVVTMY